MNSAEQTLLYLSRQGAVDVRLGKPFSFSVTVHGLLLLLLPSLWTLRSTPSAPVRLLEINLIGRQDLALKGTGNDFAVGPLKERDLVARPPKDKGPVTNGNTPKISRSVSRTPQPRAVPAAPTLAPAGPIFGRGGGVAVESGVGREKIYIGASAVRAAGGRSRNSAETGEGLVGVSGQAISLAAKRGGGGTGGGEGGYLSGGVGSVNGGNTLEHRGEAIIHYPSVSQDRITQPAEKVEIPEPSDDFFSISGQLLHRKILGIRLPSYPRWAEESGLEALIAVRLTVTPNGKVNPDVTIETTSGYPDFDKVAMDAVRGIRFAPLGPKEVPREEWGIATFNFKLKNSQKRGSL